MEKKYPIGGYAPGNYSCTCCKCGTEFSGDKRAVECEPCAVKAKEKFDALSPEQQQATLERNVIIANWMFETPLTPERDLILRIVSQWGNAIEMPNMDQWLKDYAAKAQPGPRWVKAPEFKFEEGSEYFYKYEYMEKNFKGVAKFEDGMLWATEKTVLPIGYSELYILEEQPEAGREDDLKAEIERRTKLLEDDLKRDCRLNMPGISEQEQEATWQAYKKRHNL